MPLLGTYFPDEVATEPPVEAADPQAVAASGAHSSLCATATPFVPSGDREPLSAGADMHRSVYIFADRGKADKHLKMVLIGIYLYVCITCNVSHGNTT